MKGMRTRTISIRNLSSSDQEAWRDLAARSVEPNPFYEVEFLAPACWYLRNGKSVGLLVAEDAGCFHACVPVRQVNLPRILAPPVISSWRHLHGFLGTPLVAPERGVEAVGSLLTALRGDGPWRRVVVLELFGDDGPIASYLRRAADELGLSVHVHASGERAVFCCQDEKADEPARVKRERRAKARQWRRLCGDWGDPAVIDRAGDRDSATRFLAIEVSGWKGTAGTALASRAKDATFYREVTSRFGASGRLRLYSLEAGGETLAIQTSFCAGPGLFDWKVAYDERFARYGPGAQLQLRVLDLAREGGSGWIDSCSEVDDDHQLRLSSDRRRIATLAVGGRGPFEGRVSALAVLFVKVSRVLRGLSTRTLLRQLAGSSRVIGKVLDR
jgi:CelD/BcsL family acetyltransferase involved in cellulose biosynthesis